MQTPESSCKEGFDHRRHRSRLIVMQHVPGIGDNLQPAAGYLCEPASHFVQAVDAGFTFGMAIEPARNVRIRRRNPKHRSR